MAIFPVVQSPCPVKANLSAYMDGEMCRMCKRQVFDLTALDDGERVAFFANCQTDEVCVSYKLPLKRAMAAAALAAIAVPMAAAAQDAASVEAADDYDEDMMIIVGGIKAPDQVSFVEQAEDAQIPELPVMEEVAAAQIKPVI